MTPTISDSHLWSSLFSDRTLDLTILPTEQCNFRCRYCYEQFVPGRMGRETIEAIKALMTKRAPALEHLRIGWFGGEPLLARDIVLELSAAAMALAAAHPRLHFESGMSTNGYLLTHATAAALIAHGVTAFQVSLDGPAPYHDGVRLRRDGQGTFATIWTNLLALQASTLDFIINLRLHFSRDNISVLDAFIDTLNEQFGNDQRFHFFFKAIVPLGGRNDASLRCFTDEEAAALIARFRRRLNEHTPVVGDQDAPYICYAGRPTSLVIRHDGRLAKCTVDLDGENNQVGRLRAGGVLDIDQPRIRPWLRGAVALDRDLLRCPRAYL